jgi:hypothetical protein
MNDRRKTAMIARRPAISKSNLESDVKYLPHPRPWAVRGRRHWRRRVPLGRSLWKVRNRVYWLRLTPAKVAPVFAGPNTTARLASYRSTARFWRASIALSGARVKVRLASLAQWEGKGQWEVTRRDETVRGKCDCARSGSVSRTVLYYHRTGYERAPNMLPGKQPGTHFLPECFEPAGKPRTETGSVRRRSIALSAPPASVTVATNGSRSPSQLPRLRSRENSSPMAAAATASRASNAHSSFAIGVMPASSLRDLVL